MCTEEIRNFHNFDTDFIFSHLKIMSNFYSKLTQYISENPVIFGWRERNFQDELTKVPPFDVEFKD